MNIGKTVKKGVTRKIEEPRQVPVQEPARQAPAETPIPVENWPVRSPIPVPAQTPA
jgi:hypothetical protein